MKVVALCLLAALGLVSAQYNYNEALSKSILFYEAQRTGYLPSTNRIPWRGDSFTNDRDGVIDLTGGYFDAGDHVKFGFPFAHTMIFLGWSAVDYASAYEAAGEMNNVRDAIRWGTDWLLKANQLPNFIYAQVGDGYADHAYWGRPEEWPAGNARPAFTLSASKPGSDLAGNYASALAVASLVFRSTDSSYADRCLAAARQLYTFANQYRGKYSDSIDQVNAFYGSYAYEDELAFAAAMMALVTGEETYKNDARSFWDQFGFAGYTQKFFAWGDKQVAIHVLMSRIFGDEKYKTSARQHCENWMYSEPKTPKGLVFIDAWGSLRHASNAAFGCLLVADSGIGDATAYRNFAKSQIDYALGSTGRSFVVGFGNNPPQKVHHRGSSCPDRPQVCDYSALNSPNPNPQVLYGALAGGPDQYDNYQDDRNNYQCNEVAIDYNAGFQGALAGILHAQLKNLL